MYAVSFLVYWGVEFQLGCPCCCPEPSSGLITPISFTIKGPGEKFYEFKVAPATTMGMCMDAYCTRFELKEDEVQFERFGSTRIGASQSVASLNAQDGDVIKCSQINDHGPQP